MTRFYSIFTDFLLFFCSVVLFGINRPPVMYSIHRYEHVCTLNGIRHHIENLSRCMFRHTVTHTSAHLKILISLMIVLKFIYYFLSLCVNRHLTHMNLLRITLAEQCFLITLSVHEKYVNKWKMAPTTNINRELCGGVNIIQN